MTRYYNYTRPIIASFWSDGGLGSTVRIDGVVAVVDATRIVALLDGESVGEDVRLTAVRQLAHADRVLVNKCDLVDDVACPDTLSQVAAIIKPLNPVAELLYTTRCQCVF